MSIMMKVFKDGQLFGQCDSKCYSSKIPSCQCVCTGILHGKGRNRAICILRESKSYFRRVYTHDMGFTISFF